MYSGACAVWVIRSARLASTGADVLAAHALASGGLPVQLPEPLLLARVPGVAELAQQPARRDPRCLRQAGWRSWRRLLRR